MLYSFVQGTYAPTEHDIKWLCRIADYSISSFAVALGVNTGHYGKTENLVAKLGKAIENLPENAAPLKERIRTLKTRVEEEEGDTHSPAKKERVDRKKDQVCHCGFKYLWVSASY